MPSISTAVRAAREAARITQYALSEKAGVAPRALQAFEAGSLGELSTADLARIARALELDVDALMAGEAPTPSAAVFFRQHRIADFHSEDEPKLADALERARALIAVNGLLGRPGPSRLGLRPQRVAETKAYASGYRLAGRLRSLIGNVDEPLLELQSMLEERFDILVLVDELRSRRVQAVSVRDSTSGASAVVLNASNEGFSNPYRQRVDLAHELGHILFDPSTGAIDLVADTEIELESQRARPLEQRAKAFAAELLMPRKGLGRLLGHPRSIEARSDAEEIVRRVRTLYRTPHEIAVHHLVNARYVGASLHQDLVKRPFPIDGPQEGVRTTTVLERRVAAALAAGIVSRMRALELLGLSAWDSVPAAVARPDVPS